MKFKQCFRTMIVVAGLWLIGLPAIAQDNNSFGGRLSPRPMDGRTRGQLTGDGEISAVLDGNELKNHIPSALKRRWVFHSLGVPGFVRYACQQLKQRTIELQYRDGKGVEIFDRMSLSRLFDQDTSQRLCRKYNEPR